MLHVGTGKNRGPGTRRRRRRQRTSARKSVYGFAPARSRSNTQRLIGGHGVACEGMANASPAIDTDKRLRTCGGNDILLLGG